MSRHILFQRRKIIGDRALDMLAERISNLAIFLG
jgi:hypothetical protein